MREFKKNWPFFPCSYGGKPWRASVPEFYARVNGTVLEEKQIVSTSPEVEFLFLGRFPDSTEAKDRRNLDLSGRCWFPEAFSLDSARKDFLTILGCWYSACKPSRFIIWTQVLLLLTGGIEREHIVHFRSLLLDCIYSLHFLSILPLTHEFPSF